MKKILLVITLCIASCIHSQVLINEVSTSNRSAVTDNEGDTPDWIELYNAGTTAVNLTGYRLTNNATLPQQWLFPNVSIPAGGYLSVFASEKNKVKIIDHWESLVQENNIWKYTVPAANITGWTTAAFDDASWSSGRGGLGYGDGDDSTTITPNPFMSVYARKSFVITDKSKIGALRLLMDYDDGFVAYLNGHEIAKANMPATVNYNSAASSSHEAKVYNGGSYDEFVISEEVFTPLLVNGTNVLSIQVHNDIALSTDLTLRAFLVAAISDASNDYQSLPSFFTPPLALNSIHTNFKLSASGTPVILYNASGTLINAVNVPSLKPDDTYGRFPNGSNTLRILRPTTFNASNTTASAYSGYWTDVVSFSVPAGFYAGTQSLTLSKVSSSSTIRYTTDGSIPTEASTAYTTPISITQNSVIRAACFASGYLPGKIETNTYFINQSVSLPVFSISTNPDNFFNTNTGIYVNGPASVVNSCLQQPYYCRNYWQDWEREIHVEYFNKQKVYQFEQDAGVKILGGWSRMQPLKSLQLRAGDTYGKTHFEHNFFNEPKKSNINKFETLTLRNGGNDYESTLLRDAVNHRALNSIECYDNNLDFTGYTPVVVFINGQYWGIHTLRERIDDSYFENNGGKKDVNYLEFNGNLPENIKEGTNTDFLAMVDFITNNDMSIAANYTQAKNMLDIENYVDYYCAEIFHTNWDWPHNNIRFWKPQSGGKWRHIYHDTDFGYGLFGYATPTKDELGRMISDLANDTKKNVHTPMLQKLLANAEFKNLFLNRMCDLLNTIYRPSHLKSLFDGLATEIDPEINRHLDRWGSQSPAALGGSREDWNENKDEVKNFMDARPAGVRSSLVTRYSLGGTVSVTIDVLPVGSGKIKISTIAPCTLPFTGTYFRNVPVTIEVLPSQGYTFQSWTSSVPSADGSTAAKQIMTLTQATASFTANFVATTNTPKLTFSEINYQSDTATVNQSNAGDWIELHNYGNTAIDVSGWILQDVNAYNKYVIPQGTTVAAGGYLVMVSDVLRFQAVNPAVNNFIGPIGFNLSNDGETIRLVDIFNTERVKVTYNDGDLWPLLANGKGGTLEIVNPAGDLNNPSNWKDGCRKGSPGKSFVACPCKVPNLGPDEVLCLSGTTGMTLNSNIASDASKKFTWYYNSVKIANAVSNILTATQAGKYIVMVDSLGCIKADVINLNSDITLNIPESKVSLCAPAVFTIDTKVSSTNANFLWKKDGTTLPSATRPSLVISTPGQYIVEVSGGSCITKRDTVTALHTSIVPVDAARCGVGSVTLSIANAIAGRNYSWYSQSSGGSALLSGTSYTTPSLSTTTTYYVEDADFKGGFVGQTNISVDPNNIWVDKKHTTDPYRFKFDVLKACTLNYITIFAETAQTVVVNLWASNGTTKLQTTSVQVPAGENRIPVGFNLTVGNGFFLDAQGTTGNLYYNGGEPGISSYPFTESQGYLRITGATPDWVSDNKWFPYLYKWEFSNGPGPCNRIPVTATINCVAAVEYTYLKASNQPTTVKVDWVTSYENNNTAFEIMRSTDGVNFVKIGTVNSTGTGNSTRTYTFSDLNPLAGIAYYRLRQVSTNGSTSLSSIVSVNRDLSMVTVISDNILHQVNVSASDIVDALVIYNVQGMIIESFSHVSDISLSLSSQYWPSGMYIAKISLENGQVLTKTFFVK